MYRHPFLQILDRTRICILASNPRVTSYVLAKLCQSRWLPLRVIFKYGKLLCHIFYCAVCKGIGPVNVAEDLDNISEAWESENTRCYIKFDGRTRDPEFFFDLSV